MRRALISDIHANLEALHAVLEDIDREGIEEIYCLGDIVGYGPNPVECLDLVMDRCKVTILGNHDQAALFDPEGFNEMALNAIFWTREQLDTAVGGKHSVDKRWDFLGERPKSVTEKDLLFVHGSARDPLSEYVFPQDVMDPRKMDALFSRIEHICFQGHTHLPGVFCDDGGRYCFEYGNEIDGDFVFDDRKFMVNVGSVGQPRDGDPRACYVVLEERSLSYRRVKYDVEKTARKIFATGELDDNLGSRLFGGR